MYEKIHNLYTYSFEKKNYINLFIIITMNKKKSYSTHKTQDRLC